MLSLYIACYITYLRFYNIIYLAVILYILYIYTKT
nr:MAG TPA: hypothetical protein [Caudoviricetes sp.]